MNPTKIWVWTCKWRIGSFSSFLVVMSTIICLKTIFSSSLLSFVSYGVRVLCYLYLFIYIVTRCSCFSTIMTSAISRNCLHFWGTRVHPQFSVGMCYSIFSFMCVVFCGSLIVPLLLAIVLSVLQFTAFDYLFGIFKLFLKYKKQINTDDDNNRHDMITISHMKLWSRAAVKCLQWISNVYKKYIFFFLIFQK